MISTNFRLFNKNESKGIQYQTIFELESSNHQRTSTSKTNSESYDFAIGIEGYTYPDVINLISREKTYSNTTQKLAGKNFIQGYSTVKHNV